MRIKDLPVQIKAGPEDGLAEGQFTGYASVFGNVDSTGDVVVKGAFATTLEQWKTSGKPIPLLWGHDMADPFSNIGSVQAVEDDRGLLVTGTFDLENAKAVQTYRLVKGRRVDSMSFAYEVISEQPAEVAGEKVNELLEVKLFEASIVPVGANSEAEITAVKANADALTASLKYGVVLGKKYLDLLHSADESMSAAQTALRAVMKAAEGTDDQGKASGTGPANTATKAAEEPSRNPSVDDWLAEATLIEMEGLPL